MSFTVYFDVETGGVLPQQPTIQLAAVAIDDTDGCEAGSFESKIAFDVASADPEALHINHYAAEAWKDAPVGRIVAARFAEWIQPFSSIALVSPRTGKPYRVAKLAGYNALTFDLPRLKALFGDNFFPCSYYARDTLQRVLAYFDDRPLESTPENFKLATVCAHFGVAVDGAHDALVDVRLTAALVDRLRGRF